MHPWGGSRVCPTPHFDKNTIFFRIHLLHEAVKMHTWVCTPAFFNISPPKIPGLLRVHFCADVYPEGTSQVYTTHLFLKHCFIPESPGVWGCKKDVYWRTHRHFSTFRPWKSLIWSMLIFCTCIHTRGTTRVHVNYFYTPLWFLPCLLLVRDYKNIYTCVNIGVFQNVDSTTHYFAPYSFCALLYTGDRLQ